MSDLAAVPFDETPSPVDSWQPINLVALDHLPREKPTLASGLAYPGRRHLWSGEPESAKSWAALIACAQELQQGRHAVYVDFETDEHEMLDRLRCLAIADDQIELLLYLKPTDRIEAEGVRRHVDTLITTHQPAVIVIDAYAGALDLHDLDPNKGADIEKLNRLLFEPLRSQGAAVIILDHLTKDKERRGRFAIGSERKVGVVDVHLGFEVVKPFGRGRKGLVHIKTHKDRPGYLPRPRVADLELSSDETTGLITYTITAPAQADDEHPFRPTGLMEKVSRYLETMSGSVSRNTIEDAIPGKRDYVRLALDTLARERFLEETEGARNARLYASKRAYREAFDTKKPTSPPPRPHLAPGEVKDLAPQPAPPLGGGGEDTTNEHHNLAPGEVNLFDTTTDPDDDIPW